MAQSISTAAPHSIAAVEPRCTAEQRDTVLFVLPWSPDIIGGVNEVVTNLYRRFATSNDVRARLLIDKHPCREVEQTVTQRLGIADCFYLPSPFGVGGRLRRVVAFAYRLPGAMVHLARYLRRNKVRAINIHYPSLPITTVLVSRLLAGPSIPVVLSFHGSDIQAAAAAGRIQRFLWRVMLSGCSAVVAPSRGFAREIEQTFPEVKRKLHVIHHGVNAVYSRNVAKHSRLPAELRGRRFIVSVGTFEQKKGQDVLLESFRKLGQSFPDVSVVLVGRSGPTLSSLRRQSELSGFRERVFIYPDLPHDQVLSVIDAAEIFVLPSRREPFGIVLLEAASLAVPVVATGVGGVPEILTDGETGLIVAPNDPEKLADAVGCLLSDRETAADYGNRFARVAGERFSWQNAVDKYALLFRIR